MPGTRNLADVAEVLAVSRGRRRLVHAGHLMKVVIRVEGHVQTYGEEQKDEDREALLKEWGETKETIVREREKVEQEEGTVVCATCQARVGMGARQCRHCGDYHCAACVLAEEEDAAWRDEDITCASCMFHPFEL